MLNNFAGYSIRTDTFPQSSQDQSSQSAGLHLLLWEIVIDVIVHYSRYKLPALGSIQNLCQQVGQVVSCLDVRDMGFTHFHRLTHCMRADGVAFLLKDGDRLRKIRHLGLVVSVNV